MSSGFSQTISGGRSGGALAFHSRNEKSQHLLCRLFR